MISEEYAKRYCRDDISLIENYNEAVASTERWVCHHRRGMDEGIYRDDLKKDGLYKKRPASELIFIPMSEHQRMHNIGRRRSPATREKMRQSKLGNKYWLGRHHTEGTRGKIRQAMIGNKNTLGLLWFNNGVKSIRSKECPPGFTPGRIKKN